MQSPLGILSLPLFVSHSAFHPAGREEERKERGAQGMAEGHLFPPASLFNFSGFGLLFGLRFPLAWAVYCRPISLHLLWGYQFP
jgi:hypothetical protein